MTLQDLDRRYLREVVNEGYRWEDRMQHTAELCTDRELFDLYSAWLGAGADPVTSHGRKP